MYQACYPLGPATAYYHLFCCIVQTDLSAEHVKMEESGPVGGARAGRAPPRSANDYDICFSNFGLYISKTEL